jgi:hypothetical protein
MDKNSSKGTAEEALIASAYLAGTNTRRVQRRCSGAR